MARPVVCPCCGHKIFSPQVVPPPATESDRFFFEFWYLYPKKVKYPAAQTAWRKLKITPELHHKILKSVTAWKESGAWDNQTYIPYPATFLNQMMFEDTPPKVKTKNQNFEGNEYSREKLESLYCDADAFIAEMESNMEVKQ